MYKYSFSRLNYLTENKTIFAFHDFKLHLVFFDNRFDCLKTLTIEAYTAKRF